MSNILYKRWYVKATIPSLNDFEIQEEITELQYTKFFNPDGNPTIGSTCAACIEFTLNGKIGHLNQILDFWFGEGGDEEGSVRVWRKIGRFKVMETETAKDGLFTKCKAYDAMIYAFEKEYIDNSWTDLSFNEEFGELGGATPRIILDHISSQTNIDINVEGLLNTFPVLPTGTDENKKAIWNYNCITPRPKGYTYRQMLGYIASLAGTCATMGNDNVLYFKWYSDEKNTLNTIGLDRIYEDSNDNDENTEFEVGYIECLSQKINSDDSNYEYTFTRGDGTQGNDTIAFENPYMTEPIINGLAALEDELQLFGFTARKMTFKFVGDFRLNVGQTLYVTHNGKEYKIPIMQITHSWDGGLITEVTSTCETESQNEINIKGPMTQSVEKNRTMIITNDTAKYLNTPGKNGFKTDYNGNFRHKSSSGNDYFSIQDSSGVDKFKINYESGIIDLQGKYLGTEQNIESISDPMSDLFAGTMLSTDFRLPTYLNNNYEYKTLLKKIRFKTDLQFMGVEHDTIFEIDFHDKIFKIKNIGAEQFSIIDSPYSGRKIATLKCDENNQHILFDVLDRQPGSGNAVYDLLINTNIFAEGYSGNASNVFAKFEEYENRENIESYELLSTTLAKIHKWFSDLKDVAFSGEYSDLIGIPENSQIENGVLTIQKNGIDIQIFSANQSENVTANIIVPTKTSEIENDEGFITMIQINAMLNDYLNKDDLETENIDFTNYF